MEQRRPGRPVWLIPTLKYLCLDYVLDNDHLLSEVSLPSDLVQEALEVRLKRMALLQSVPDRVVKKPVVRIITVLQGTHDADFFSSLEYSCDILRRLMGVRVVMEDEYVLKEAVLKKRLNWEDENSKIRLTVESSKKKEEMEEEKGNQHQNPALSSQQRQQETEEGEEMFSSPSHLVWNLECKLQDGGGGGGGVRGNVDHNGHNARPRFINLQQQQKNNNNVGGGAGGGQDLQWDLSGPSLMHAVLVELDVQSRKKGNTTKFHPSSNDNNNHHSSSSSSHSSSTPYSTPPPSTSTSSSSDSSILLDSIVIIVSDVPFFGSLIGRRCSICPLQPLLPVVTPLSLFRCALRSLFFPPEKNPCDTPSCPLARPVAGSLMPCARHWRMLQRNCGFPVDQWVVQVKQALPRDTELQKTLQVLEEHADRQVEEARYKILNE